MLIGKHKHPTISRRRKQSSVLVWLSEEGKKVSRPGSSDTANKNTVGCRFPSLNVKGTEHQTSRRIYVGDPDFGIGEETHKEY